MQQWIAYMLAERPDPFLLQEITQILTYRPSQAKPILLRLGDTIYDLVEHHMPQVGIQPAHEFYYYVRPKHDLPPRYESGTVTNTQLNQLDNTKGIHSNA